MNSIIAFDLDGTLIDSREDIADAVNEYRTMHGLPRLPLPQIVSYTGNGPVKLLERSVPELLKAAVTMEEMLEEEGECYHKRLVNKTRLYPGVLETMPRLAENYKLAVVSNKQDNFSRIILDKLGILPYITSVVGSGRIQEKKPEPQPMWLAMKECDAVAEGSWFVGDHWTDLGVARASGVRACFCAYGMGNMGGRRADAIIWDFSQILTIL